MKYDENNEQSHRIIPRLRKTSKIFQGGEEANKISKSKEQGRLPNGPIKESFMGVGMFKPRCREGKNF